MRYVVIFRTEAENDLNELLDYIADNSSAAIAVNYVNRIERSCLGLSVFPNRGKARDDLAPGVRTLNFEGRATIAYRVEAGMVLILRIFYAGQDIEAAFKPS